MRLLGRRSGRSPLHLIGHLALFGVAAYALDQIFSGGDIEQLLAWYVGFVLLHDLVLLPAYTGADRVAQALLAGTPRSGPRAVPLINHVRVPAVVSGVLLLVYAPLITRAGDHTYFFYSGHHVEGYLRNWLLITLGLLAGSGLVYAVRVSARRRRH
jgi:hypothetical protein